MYLIWFCGWCQQWCYWNCALIIFALAYHALFSSPAARQPCFRSWDVDAYKINTKFYQVNYFPLVYLGEAVAEWLNDNGGLSPSKWVVG